MIPSRFGIDLACLNIQRGRDHGLPDYNTIRKFYTGSPVSRFSQISSDSAQAAGLKSLYGNVNNIDPWIGMLSEDHVPNTSIGKTQYMVLKAQFEHLRDGDYYFYMNDPYLPATVKAIVTRTKFSDVVKRNTNLTILQDNLFFQDKCPNDNDEENAPAVAALAADSGLVGVNKEPNQGVRIFPNPANSVVHVDFGSWTGPVSVRIISGSNNVTKSQMATASPSGLEINISDLPPGVYFVNISNGGERKTIKLVKTGN